mmetsp:Transcript_28600/g.92783  ORF Transcript_28600/g.92783 Transcript_28600/m.92783 type:complete len:249 (-) Transcript_28600:212-958(-)
MAEWLAKHIQLPWPMLEPLDATSSSKRRLHLFVSMFALAANPDEERLCRVDEETATGVQGRGLRCHHRAIRRLQQDARHERWLIHRVRAHQVETSWWRWLGHALAMLDQLAQKPRVWATVGAHLLDHLDRSIERHSVPEHHVRDSKHSGLRHAIHAVQQHTAAGALDVIDRLHDLEEEVGHLLARLVVQRQTRVRNASRLEGAGHLVGCQVHHVRHAQAFEGPELGRNIIFRANQVRIHLKVVPLETP